MANSIFHEVNVAHDHQAWRTKNLSPEKRAALLVESMTFEEKAKFLSRHLHPTPGINDWSGGVDGSDRLFYPPI